LQQPSWLELLSLQVPPSSEQASPSSGAFGQFSLLARRAPYA
jgi:hypothetical protein